MGGRDIYSQKGQAVVGAPVIGIGLGFLLATWSCNVVELVDSTQWAALVLLRCIMLADHLGVPVYLYDNGGLLQYLPTVFASIGPLLGVLVRQGC
jgi:hypothetical protein